MTIRYGPWSGLGPWIFFVTKSTILESNNVGDINIFGFSHQIMNLIILTNRIKDQVVLIHLGVLLFYEGKCL